MLRRPLTEITLQPEDMAEIDDATERLWNQKDKNILKDVETQSHNHSSDDIFSPPAKKKTVQERVGLNNGQQAK